MIALIRKWGNSLAVQIPGDLAERIGLYERAQVTITLDSGGLLIRPINPRYNLAELLNGITRQNLHTETSTGICQGDEVW